MDSIQYKNHRSPGPIAELTINIDPARPDPGPSPVQITNPLVKAIPNLPEQSQSEPGASSANSGSPGAPSLLSNPPSLLSNQDTAFVPGPSASESSPST